MILQNAKQTANSGGTDRHVGLEDDQWSDPLHLRRRTHDRHPRQQLVVAISGCSGVEHGPVADSRIHRPLRGNLPGCGRVRRHPADVRHEKMQ